MNVSANISKMALLVASLLAFFSPVLIAEETGELNSATANRIIEGLKSNDERIRASAIRTVHYLGEPALKDYSRMLGQARMHHERQLMKVLEKTYGKHAALAIQLDHERERIYDLLQIDYKKDPSKVAMLRKEMKSLERPFKNTLRAAETKPVGDLKTVDSKLDILREIHFQLWQMDRGAGDETWSLTDGNQPDPVTERREILEDTLGGRDFLDQQTRFEKSRKEAAQIEKVGAANKQAGSWANGGMKSFASILNSQRALLGLEQLELEERLSEASFGHSQDMSDLGFFAHESPVPGKTSPADRARMAEFEHRWTGENIYMGSSAPKAAYDAWFASDGHRFIMTARGPNLLGVGIFGRHWTMMTGARR